MRRILAILAIFSAPLLSSESSLIKPIEYIQQDTKKADPKLTEKVFAANKLQEGNLKYRKENGLDSGNLSVTVAGEENDILYIQDDSEQAIKWLQDSQQEKLRTILMDYGFKLIVLKNKIHGIYVVDLTNGNIFKADVMDLKKK